MPPPVILLTALLIGYPLVQVTAIGLRRKKRLRFNATVDALLADRRLSPGDRQTVRRLATDSRGGLGTIKALLLLPKSAFVAASEDALVPRPRAQTSQADPIVRLRDQAVELEWATHPVASSMAIPLAFVAWCCGAGLVVLKGAPQPSLPTFSDLVRSAAPASAAPLAGTHP